MKRVLFFLSVGLFLGGCGPQSSDFVGVYGVSTVETIGACEGGSSRSTTLEDLSSIEISERTDTKIAVSARECLFLATVTETDFFEGEEQSCSVAYEDPEITITFTSEGRLEGSGLEILLKGTYETTSEFGFKFTCDYELQITE